MKNTLKDTLAVIGIVLIFVGIVATIAFAGSHTLQIVATLDSPIERGLAYIALAILFPALFHSTTIKNSQT
jgi:hypothetical protein